MSALRWLVPFSAFPLIIYPATVPEPHSLTGIEYARVGDVSLRLDASIPRGPGPFPAAILVHGGAWVRGDRRTEVEPLFKPLSEARIAWFSIDYRLAGNYLQFGDAVEDVEAAIRFVKSHAAEYRVDPNRIALIGESAGGHLAALAALASAPDLRVRTVVAFYSPTDLVGLAKNSALVPQWVRQNLEGSPWESMILSRLKQLSPIDRVHAGMPPFLLIHGTDDRLVPFQESRAMCDRIKSVGGKCELYPVRGAGHGFRWWSASATAAYQREMLRWLSLELG
jgi:acetyl esterase